MKHAYLNLGQKNSIKVLNLKRKVKSFQKRASIYYYSRWKLQLTDSVEKPKSGKKENMMVFTKE